jgi:hypothetical protein
MSSEIAKEKRKLFIFGIFNNSVPKEYNLVVDGSDLTRVASIRIDSQLWIVLNFMNCFTDSIIVSTLGFFIALTTMILSLELYITFTCSVLISLPIEQFNSKNKTIKRKRSIINQFHFFNGFLIPFGIRIQ